MCRLLLVKSETEFDIAEQLEKFAHICRNSPEYQGHGWGFAAIKDSSWSFHKSINPIWEDSFESSGRTNYLMVHARSAFQDKGICIDNNMPFNDERHVFIFNGELRGVKIRAEGRIGAEKLFNFIRRFDQGNMLNALNRSVPIIQKKTAHIRGMNFIIGDGKKIYINSLFNQDEEDYFTLYRRTEPGRVTICSAPLTGDQNWESIGNGTIEEIE